MKLEYPEVIFLTWLELAAFKAVQFGQFYVRQKLVYDFRFELHLNMASDDLAGGDFHLYPDDDGRIVNCSTFQDAAAELVRKSRIPVWVDICASGFSRDYTLLKLICAGRFTDDINKLYYFERGTGCFGVKSPVLPPGYKDGTKFKLTKA